MALFKNIPTNYLIFVPATYYAIFGAYNIVSFLINDDLELPDLLFNLVLFAPLIVPHRAVLVFMGSLFSVVNAYLFLALIVFLIQHLSGSHMKYPFDTFVIGPLFVGANFLAAISMVIAGKRKYKLIKREPEEADSSQNN